jgi:hypothetical protein
VRRTRDGVGSPGHFSTHLFDGWLATCMPASRCNSCIWLGFSGLSASGNGATGARTTMHAAASTRKHVPSLVSLAARTLTRGRVPGDGAGAERGSGGVKKKVIRPPGPTCRLAPRGVSGSPGSARDTPLARSRGRATRGRCAPGLGTTSPWRGVLGVLRPFVNRERLCLCCSRPGGRRCVALWGRCCFWSRTGTVVTERKAMRLQSRRFIT